MDIKEFDSSTGQLKQISDLFHLCYKKPMPEGFWNWRYRNNPFTEKLFIRLMYDGENLAGHYAVSPIKMKVNDNVFMAALSMTTITHPDYSGRGVFKTLAESVYDEMKASGLKMVMGFPNKNSHYGLINKLHFKDVFQIPMLTRSTESLKKIDAVYDHVEACTDDIVNTYFNRENGVFKDANYLKWRYDDCPYSKYYKIEVTTDAIKNLAIFKSYNLVGSSCEVDIVELKGELSDLTITSTLNAIKEILFEEGLNVAKYNIWCNLYSKDYRHHEKAGFVPDLPITYLGMRTFDESIPIRENLGSWNICLGDSDVY